MIVPVCGVPPGGEGREPWDEEVESGEGDHVDRELPDVGVQLTGEPQARSHPGHRVLEGAKEQLIWFPRCDRWALCPYYQV